MYLDEKDPEETYRRFGGNALHMHLADSGREVVGSGKIDFEQTIGWIRKSGYMGALSHECSSFGTETDTMKTAFKNTDDILRKGDENDLL